MGSKPVPSECPCCGAAVDSEARVDNNGSFRIDSCSDCPWGEIVDPDNPDLEAEYRPRCC